MAAYKTSIRNFFDARDNLMQEIEESGPVGPASALALLQHFVAHAWWSGVRPDYYARVIAEPKAVAKATGIKYSTVYRSMAYLEDHKWIRISGHANSTTVEVLLKKADRDVRTRHRSKLPRSRKSSSNRETDSHIEKDFLESRIATVSDLRKHPHREQRFRATEGRR